MQKTLIVSLLLSTILFSKEVSQEIIDTGDKLSKELLTKLSSKLSHEIKNNSLLSAAKFCNSNALTLTEEVNLHQVQGISVKRISLKERNSANTPKADEAAALKSMQKMLNKKELPEYIIEQEGKTYKYYKPLVIKKEVCLRCHGDISSNPEISKFIKEAYPDDKAIGYKMGDLRGAILVEIKE